MGVKLGNEYANCVAAVTAVAGSILPSVSLLGVAGTLDNKPYVELITGLPLFSGSKLGGELIIGKMNACLKGFFLCEYTDTAFSSVDVSFDASATTGAAAYWLTITNNQTPMALTVDKFGEYYNAGVGDANLSIPDGHVTSLTWTNGFGNVSGDAAPAVDLGGNDITDGYDFLFADASTSAAAGSIIVSGGTNATPNAADWDYIGLAIYNGWNITINSDEQALIVSGGTGDLAGANGTYTWTDDHEGAAKWLHSGEVWNISHTGTVWRFNNGVSNYNTSATLVNAVGWTGGNGTIVSVLSVASYP